MIRTARVQEIAEQLRGVTFSKTDASKQPGAGLIPVLRAGNINDGRLPLDDLLYIPESKVSAKQRIRENDVLIAASSGSLAVVGKAARSPRDMSAAFGAFLKVLRPGPEVDAVYFAHYFQTTEYRRQISSLASGTSINNLKASDLNNLVVPLPPLDEQRRIAAILDQADAIRTKRRQVIAHLGDLIQARFDQFFACDPEHWLSLEDLAERVVVAYVGPTTKHFRDEGIPYLRTGNIGNSEIRTNDLAHVTSEFHESQKKSQLRSGDVLISRVIGHEVRQAIVPATLAGANCGNVIIVRPSVRVLNTTLSGFIAQRSTQRYLMGRQVGSAQSVVNTTVLKELRFPDYKIEEQELLQSDITLIQHLRTNARVALTAANELFASLQALAFKGEL